MAKSLTEIREERELRNKQRAEAKAVQDAVGVSKRVSKLNMKRDVAYPMLPLHALKLAPSWGLHLYDGPKPCFKICDEHKGTKNKPRNCEVCQKDSEFDGRKALDKHGRPKKCWPKDTVFIIGWIPTLVDKEYEFDEETVNSETGEITIETKTGKYNPVKVVPVPHGYQGKNLPVFEASEDKGDFTKDMFILMRRSKKSEVDLGGWDVPVYISKNKYIKDMAGNEAQFKLSDQAKAIQKITSAREIAKLILTAFDDPESDLLLPEEEEEFVSADPENPFAGNDTEDEDNLEAAF